MIPSLPTGIRFFVGPRRTFFTRAPTLYAIGRLDMPSSYTLASEMVHGSKRLLTRAYNRARLNRISDF
jgi:hypothetical protein